MQSLFGKREEELPKNLGELLSDRLCENACPDERQGITVAKCYGQSLSPLPVFEKAAALKCSSALRQRLAGLLQAQELKVVSLGRRGKLNTGLLHKLATGNPRIFKKEVVSPGQNAAVHILLDGSYSMNGQPITLARQACFAVAKALSLIKGVNPAVTVFPFAGLNGVYPVLKHGKKFTDKFLVEATGGTPLTEALWWVAQTIYPLPEARKIILVVTDGMSDNLETAKETIARLQKLGMELYGLGIGLEEIQNLLPGKSRVITELAGVTPALFGLLQETLLKWRQL